jgi:capsule polysaccharide export protein KpsC/LpsZ
VINPIYNFIYASILNPLKAKFVNFYLQDKYVYDFKESENFIFFPLHTEPEVSLLVYGRPFVNQIELIRMIALSMPIDKKLYVKEHPWMVGKRSLSAYKKILNIPRVKLISPKIESRKIVQKSDLVSVITGSIALEAAIVGKPVITFGDCPYNLLPDKNVIRVRDIRYLNNIINDSLNNYEYDKDALIAYVAANYEISESINLYSSLLNKENVHQERENEYFQEINNLVSYAINNLLDEVETVQTSKDTANW